jgi:6-pyruvoyltetrahydropterin/6-carboxytetrahydropterin synthase
MFELSKQFSFEAAHTLRRTVDAAPSRRIHGHSYRAEVTIRGERDANGMVLDLALFSRAIDVARDNLDHHFLDEVPNLGPATIENLSAWIWHIVEPACPGLARVAVWRESSGDRCTYYGPAAQTNV